MKVLALNFDSSLKCPRIRSAGTRRVLNTVFGDRHE